MLRRNLRRIIFHNTLKWYENLQLQIKFITTWPQSFVYLASLAVCTLQHRDKYLQLRLRPAKYSCHFTLDSKGLLIPAPIFHIFPSFPVFKRTMLFPICQDSQTMKATYELTSPVHRCGKVRGKSNQEESREDGSSEQFRASNVLPTKSSLFVWQAPLPWGDQPGEFSFSHAS